MYDFQVFTVIYSSLHGLISNSLLVSSVGRALHRYRKGPFFATAQEVFITVKIVFHIHVSCFVGDETEIKEPQNVINYPVKFKYPRLSLHLWPYINFESLYAYQLLDCLSWI